MEKNYLETPTILTAKQFDLELSVKKDGSDITLHELFDMFKSIVLGLGYTNDSWENVIIDLATSIAED